MRLFFPVFTVLFFFARFSFVQAADDLLCRDIIAQGQRVLPLSDGLSEDHRMLFSKLLARPGGTNTVQFFPERTVANDGRMMTLVLVSHVSDKDSIHTGYLLLTEDFTSFYPVPDTEKAGNGFTLVSYEGLYYILMTGSSGAVKTVFRLDGNSRRDICSF